MPFRSKSVSLPVVVAALLLVAFGTAMASSSVVRSADPAPVTAVEGSLTASENVTIDEQDLRYNGTSVTGVTLTVTNTASEDRETTIYLAIYDGNGTVVRTETVTETFGANAQSTTIVPISSTPIESIGSIETTIQVTNE